MRKIVFALFFILSILPLFSVVNATTIEILADGWRAPFGEPRIATLGQTFRLNPGDDNLLQSVTFYLNDNDHLDNVDFTFYLYDFRGNCLFSSEQMGTTHQPGWEAFTVDIDGIELETGRMYAWFLSAADFFDGAWGASRIAINTANVYENGFFVWSNNRNDFNPLLGRRAWRGARNLDLAFTMELSPNTVHAPEPCTVFLVASGLIGLAGFRKKLRRK